MAFVLLSDEHKKPLTHHKELNLSNRTLNLTRSRHTSAHKTRISFNLLKDSKKFTLEKATKAQRGSTGMALLFL
jgi:hypothetical protein